jgi:hypothetical protein
MRKGAVAVMGREAAAAVAAELEDSLGNAAAAAAAAPVLSPLSETLWRDRAAAGGVLLGDVSARLAWRDLTVTVALGTGDTQAVLQGLTGHAEPGTITALMGPSGSGKSTLLDALAGRLAANAFLDGTVLLNGRKANLSFGAAVRTSSSSSCHRFAVGTYVTLSSPWIFRHRRSWSLRRGLVTYAMHARFCNLAAFRQRLRDRSTRCHASSQPLHLWLLDQQQ